MKRAQAGFTLLEIMVVVALVGTLAALAIPSFTSSSRKSKSDSEVNSFFAELRVREEQYFGEYGVYLSTGTSESDTYPATPSSSAQTLTGIPATWTTLKVNLPESSARCGYVVMAGTPTTAAGPLATGQFGYVVPSHNWFYVLAHCNMDGSSSTDAYYFISSESAQLQSVNAGH